VPHAVDQTAEVVRDRAPVPAAALLPARARLTAVLVRRIGDRALRSAVHVLRTDARVLPIVVHVRQSDVRVPEIVVLAQQNDAPDLQILKTVPGLVPGMNVPQSAVPKSGPGPARLPIVTPSPEAETVLRRAHEAGKSFSYFLENRAIIGQK